MAIREIHTFPDAVLKRPAEAVTDIDGAIAALRRGHGRDHVRRARESAWPRRRWASSQRIIVLDVPHEDEGPGKHLMKLVNPEIVERDGSIVWEEGCLSVPDFTAPVTRAKRILLRAWTPEQKEIEIEAEELLAVALQHEIDHLDGKLFLDRLSQAEARPLQGAAAQAGASGPTGGPSERRERSPQRALSADDALAHPLHGDAALRRHDSRGAARAARSGGRRRLPARPPARPGPRGRAAGGEDAGPGARRARAAARAGPRPERSSTISARSRPTWSWSRPTGASCRARSSTCRRAAASTCTRRSCRGTAAPRRSRTPSWRATAVTGVSIMAMSEEMDAGDVLLVRETPIRADDTTGTLTARLAALGRETRSATPSTACATARSTRRRSPPPASRSRRASSATHARLVWTRPAVELERLVRAMQPAPAAFTTLGGKTAEGAPRGAGSRRRRPGDAGHGDRRDARRHRRRDGRRRAAAARGAARGQAAAGWRRRSSPATACRREHASAGDARARRARRRARCPRARRDGRPPLPTCSSARASTPCAAPIARSPRELVYGALAWQGRLDHHLGRLVRGPLDALDPPVRAALRLGLYQLLFLDRVPAYAAVDASVRLAHRSGRGAAGLVNAVLRRAAREGRERARPARCHGRSARPARRRVVAPTLAGRSPRRRDRHRRAARAAGGAQRQRDRSPCA